MPAPNSETRYATHMAALDGPEFEMRFFTWRYALLGRYEIFHLHWPEQLLSRTTGLTGRIRRMRAKALVARLQRRRTPVIYTLHNHRPHDAIPSPEEQAFTTALADLTRLEIHLVPEPGHSSLAATVDIPHGSYREPFSRYSREAAVPGRILFFGIMKEYKGIERLVSEFGAIDDPSLGLRIVGEPRNGPTVSAIDAAAQSHDRINTRYGFISDEQLVLEVTAASLVVLPYTELHSSGAALAALSLDRPVLLPASPTSYALRDEAGKEWVHIFAPPLTAADLQRATASPPPSGSPNLEGRRWDVVKAAHTKAYRATLDGRPHARDDLTID